MLLPGADTVRRTPGGYGVEAIPDNHTTGEYQLALDAINEILAALDGAR